MPALCDLGGECIRPVLPLCRSYVGNYDKISHVVDKNPGPSQIYDGTTRMRYATSFGKLEPVPVGKLEPRNNNDDTSFEKRILGKIRKNGTLNCGVIVPDR